MRKIAILGSATSTLHQAPFPDRTWEIWALGPEHRRVTRYFEAHKDKDIKPFIREHYKTKGADVYSLHEIAGVTTVTYPIHEANCLLGEYVNHLKSEEYYTSSIAYMIALAILEHAQGREVSHIGLWGVEMLSEGEYGVQRSCAEFLLGYAAGMKIQVCIPGRCTLLKANHVYGRTERPVNPGPFSIEFLEKRAAHYQNMKEKLEFDLITVQGALQETNLLLEYARHYERGGYVPDA